MVSLSGVNVNSFKNSPATISPVMGKDMEYIYVNSEATDLESFPLHLVDVFYRSCAGSTRALGFVCAEKDALVLCQLQW